jgi:hypothetical protein
LLSRGWGPSVSLDGAKQFVDDYKQREWE